MASSRCHRVRGVALLSFAVMFTNPALGATVQRGLAESANGTNTALLVGVSHGLSGLGIDLGNVEAMVTNPAYRFNATTIEEGKAHVADIVKELTQGAQAAKDDGTFLFYFTGHGNVGLIWPQDKTMTLGQIRDAIQAGRRNLGPLKRLVLIYDSCHAGSMLDPMRRALFAVPSQDPALMSALTADAMVRAMSEGQRDGTRYWEKLMVIASSRSDETSLASPQGSIFTNAMKKAFDESIAANETVGTFFTKAQRYTQGHHPVARFVPDSLQLEPMAP